MSNLVDIEEFKRRKQKSLEETSNSTLAVFTNILMKDSPQGLKDFMKDLEENDESSK